MDEYLKGIMDRTPASQEGAEPVAAPVAWQFRFGPDYQWEHCDSELKALLQGKKGVEFRPLYAHPPSPMPTRNVLMQTMLDNLHQVKSHDPDDFGAYLQGVDATADLILSLFSGKKSS